MSQLPIITSDRALFEKVSGILRGDGASLPDLHHLENPAKALEFLSLEMPELMIVSFSDSGFDAYALLDRIMDDPWLLHGGIVALCGGFVDKEYDKRSASVGSSCCDIHIFARSVTSFYESKSDAAAEDFDNVGNEYRVSDIELFDDVI